MADSIRTGTTVTNEISLRPGLNTLMAVIPRASAPADPDRRMVMVAQALGNALGEEARYTGRDPTGITQSLFYIIGKGRPVTINEVPSTPKWNAWYAKLDSPVGPDVFFMPVGIDWRGESVKVVAPVGVVAFPNGNSPRVILNNWPDGNYEQQVAYMQSASRNASASGFYNYLSTGMKSLDQFVGSMTGSNIGAIIGWTAALGLVTYILAKTLTMEAGARAGARAQLR